MESSSNAEETTGDGEYRVPNERRGRSCSKRQGLKYRKAGDKKKLAFAAQHQERETDESIPKELKTNGNHSIGQLRLLGSHGDDGKDCSTPESTIDSSEQRSSKSCPKGTSTDKDFDQKGEKPSPSSELEIDLREELQKMWRLTTSFVIRPPVSLPFLVGWEQDDKVLLRDLWSDELYITNLRDGITREVFVNQLKGDVFHCAVLGDDRMVYCDSRSGLVHVCRTMDGQHLKTIATTHRPSTHMYSVAVDHRGHIIFGVRDGTIFVIDPEESKIVSSFNVDCKIDKVVATVSGYVVIRSGIAKLNVVRDGNVVHTITDPDWCWASCVAHPVHDLVYVAYSKDTDGSNRRIMTMRPTGEVLKDDVLELGDAPHRFMRPSMIVTRSGKIIVCDNGQLLMYELKDTR